MILMLSMRSINLGFADTKTVYYEAFNRFKTYNSIDLAIKDAHFRNEPLMAIYIYMIVKLFDSFRLFLILSATFSLLPVIRLIKKEREAYLAILYFFSFYYFFYVYLIKQMLAMAVIIIAFSAIREKKPMKFVCMCAIASAIHKFAWPCFVAYPLCRYVKFKKFTYVLISLLIAIGLFFPKDFINLIIKFDPTNLMVSYINIYSRNTSLNFGLFLNIGILIICAGMRKKVKENQEDYNILLILSTINCILNSYSLIITEFQRLAFFFGIYNSILFSRAVEFLPNKYQKKQMYTYLIIIFLILYGLGRTAINTRCMPYKFWWVN